MSRVRSILAVTVAAGLLVAAAPAAPTGAPAGLGATPSAVHRLPLAAGLLDPAIDVAPVDPVAHDLVLVQLRTRGDTASVDALDATGAVLLQPLAPVSYLVWADAAQTRAIRAMSGVRFVGVLPPRYRVNPDVAGASMLRVTTVLPSADLADVAVEVTPRRFTQLTGAVLTLPGGAALAEVLAARPDVYSVTAADDLLGVAALRDERTAAIVAQGVKDPTGPYDPAEMFGADGTGVTVAVVDGGADVTHPELSDRTVTCTSYTPTLGADCLAQSSDDAIGHGTHVSGIVLGDGSTGLGDGGLSGYRFGRGVAPGADLHIQNAINAAASTPSITTLFQTSVRAGAAVVQNSWGPSGTPKGYDEPTRQADAAVRDADPGTPGNQQLGVVFSIMNGSGGTSTQGAPDEGKNILAIGGSKSGRPGAPNGDDLCTCSAHGPNLDGSRLVDLVAPGQGVMSTRAAYGTLCGVPSQQFPSPLHATCTGTSMASPHVSGAYAVFTQAWRQQHTADPSPAMVKAAFVNTAIDLAPAGSQPGKDANGKPMSPVPNEQQGWGRLHLGGAMTALRGGTSVYRDQTTPFDASGEVYEVAVAVLDAGQPMRVTLAYTDAFGHGQGGTLRSLVNDLDLEVQAPDGTLLRGNVFLAGRSVAGGSRDTLNNLENVWLPTPSVGTYLVRVRATEIIGDGVPSVGDTTDQDFALVISNAA